MDKALASETLQRGAEALGIRLEPGHVEVLLRLQDELLRWNQKINLTAITDPHEVLEKHLLDSVAVLLELEGIGSVLDIGTGAGFPGLVIKICRPDVRVTLVDTVAKKLGFHKHIVATFRLPQVKSVHTRALGRPTEEGIGLSDIVVCRALMDLNEWLLLAKPYLQPGGAALAMLGQAPSDAALQALAETHGYQTWSIRRYRLPFSGADRAIARFRIASI